VTTELSPEDSAKVQLMADLARPDTYAKARLGMTLHPKQGAVLRDLFKPKSRVAARCANEVGKTSHIAVAAILYNLEMLDGQCISTAGSWMQVSQQLIPKLKAQSFRYPRWEFLDTAIKIDQEVRKLVNHGYETAKQLISDNRETLERIAKALIEREVLDANEIKLLVDGKDLPSRPTPTKPDDSGGVQHVIKPDLQPGRAKGGEHPAPA